MCLFMVLGGLVLVELLSKLEEGKGSSKFLHRNQYDILHAPKIFVVTDGRWRASISLNSISFDLLGAACNLHDMGMPRRLG